LISGCGGAATIIASVPLVAVLGTIQLVAVHAERAQVGLLFVMSCGWPGLYSLGRSGHRWVINWLEGSETLAVDWTAASTASLCT